MSVLPFGFWSGWVIAITLLGIGGLAWLLFSVYSSRPDEAQPSDTVWDDTLSEGSAEPPKWWFFMLFGFLIVSVIYLLLYPGLGHFPGYLEWNQYSHFEKGMEYYHQKTGATHNRWENAPFEELMKDESAMASARRLYANNCAACHGDDGRGQLNIFPNLRDDKWQWGNSETQLIETITQGRSALMPAWRAALGEDGGHKAVQYILYLSSSENSTADKDELLAGEKIYKANCVACHGDYGRGNAALGAPSLRDGIWLYGEDAILETILNGRNGVMPAQKNRLEKSQIRVLAAWLAGGIEISPPQP